MKWLSWSDHRKMATFTRGLYGKNSVKDVSRYVVRELPALIGCNSMMVVLNRFKTGYLDVWAETVGPALQPLLPTMWELRNQHPGAKDHRFYTKRTVTLSDLLPLRQWKRTALFNEAYSTLGMHEQLAGTFPFARPDLGGLILNRSRRTFSQRDRLVLNLLRFHISEACRTAKLVEANPGVALAEAFAPLVDGGTIVLDPDGAVLFMSSQAQDQLATFFAAEKPFQTGLPVTVKRWVHREQVSFGTEALALRPLRPLVIRRGETSLHIRLSSARSVGVQVLLLRAEGPAIDLEKLALLGLGPRATEVLYWASQGKTNAEIGTILGMATGTVKTHLKAIFDRLGIENRTSAAVVISGLLGRSSGL
jgi:DNA-binding CsgD family transcriptional regulator